MYRLTCKLPIALTEALFGMLAMAIIIFVETLHPTLLGILATLSVMGIANSATTFSFLYIFHKNPHETQREKVAKIYDGIRFTTMAISIIIGASMMRGFG